jgi:DNA-binding GntR family transcriptional regulator
VTDLIGQLDQKSTPSIIADKLRQAIAHRELEPGSQLGEAELAGFQRLTPVVGEHHALAGAIRSGDVDRLIARLPAG